MTQYSSKTIYHACNTAEQKAIKHDIILIAIHPAPGLTFSRLLSYESHLLPSELRTTQLEAKKTIHNICKYDDGLRVISVTVFMKIK